MLLWNTSKNKICNLHLLSFTSESARWPYWFYIELSPPHFTTKLRPWLCMSNMWTKCSFDNTVNLDTFGAMFLRSVTLSYTYYIPTNSYASTDNPVQNWFKIAQFLHLFFHWHLTDSSLLYHWHWGSSKYLPLSGKHERKIVWRTHLHLDHCFLAFFWFTPDIICCIPLYPIMNVWPLWQ